MEPTAALAKALATALPKLATFAVKKALGRRDVTRFLREHGYTKHEDDFAVHYTHALVIRSKAGAREALLELLSDKAVIGAFRRTWPAEDMSPFVEKLGWAVSSLTAGDEARSMASLVGHIQHANTHNLRRSFFKARGR